MRGAFNQSVEKQKRFSVAQKTFFQLEAGSAFWKKTSVLAHASGFSMTCPFYPVSCIRKGLDTANVNQLRRTLVDDGGLKPEPRRRWLSRRRHSAGRPHPTGCCA